MLCLCVHKYITFKSHGQQGIILPTNKCTIKDSVFQKSFSSSDAHLSTEKLAGLTGRCGSNLQQFTHPLFSPAFHTFPVPLHSHIPNYGTGCHSLCLPYLCLSTETSLWWSFWAQHSASVVQQNQSSALHRKGSAIPTGNRRCLQSQPQQCWEAQTINKLPPRQSSTWREDTECLPGLLPSMVSKCPSSDGQVSKEDQYEAAKSNQLTNLRSVEQGTILWKRKTNKVTSNKLTRVPGAFLSTWPEATSL